VAQQTIDYATAFKAMAERAADTSIKDTAGILRVPTHRVHRFLDEKGLRLLCISVAHEAMALYTKRQLTEAEQTRKGMTASDEADLAQRQSDEWDAPGAAHPGC
jgi:hypothetical protein